MNTLNVIMLPLALVLFCGRPAAPDPVQNAPESDTRLAQMIISPDPKVRMTAANEILKTNRTAPEILRSTIESFRQPWKLERVHPWGPETTENSGVLVLTSAGETALPYLFEGLRDSDWNVRRYSALTIGMICSPSSEEDLLAALDRELEAEPIKIKLDERETNLLSVYLTVVTAAARVNPGRVTTTLLNEAESDSYKGALARVGLGAVAREYGLNLDPDQPLDRRQFGLRAARLRSSCSPHERQ